MVLKKKNNRKNVILKYHAWIGSLASLFILSLVITGVLLNYPDLLKRSVQSTDPFKLNPHRSFMASTGYLFLATDSQLFVSLDKGTLFKPLRTPFTTKYLVGFTESEKDIYIALKNGVVFKANKKSLLWEMLPNPDTLDIYSISYHDSMLWITAYEGLFSFNSTSWQLNRKNDSPLSIYQLIKAIHTGYPPFGWLHSLNSIASILLIIIVITGLYLFAKFYIKTLTKSTK
jgi:hypothetical protein